MLEPDEDDKQIFKFIFELKSHSNHQPNYLKPIDSINKKKKRE